MPRRTVMDLWDEIKIRFAWRASNVTKHTKLLARDLGIDEREASALILEGAQRIERLVLDGSISRATLMSHVCVQGSEAAEDRLEQRLRAYVEGLNENELKLFELLQQKPSEVAKLMQTDMQTTVDAMTKMYVDLRMLFEDFDGLRPTSQPLHSPHTAQPEHATEQYQKVAKVE